MGFFDAFKKPLEIGGQITKKVEQVAEGAAVVKAKFDLIGADLDGDGKSQIENIKEQGVKMAHRAFGDAALKVAAPGETPEQKAAREKALAEEKTTAKLIAKTRKEWAEEAHFYEVEGKVLVAFVAGFTKALLFDVKANAANKVGA